MSAALELLIEFTTQPGPTERERIAAWRLLRADWSTPVPDLIRSRILDECYEGHITSAADGAVRTASINLSVEELVALPVPLWGAWSVVPHDHAQEACFATAAQRFGGVRRDGRWEFVVQESLWALCHEMFGVKCDLHSVKAIAVQRLVNLTPHAIRVRRAASTTASPEPDDLVLPSEGRAKVTTVSREAGNVCGVPRVELSYGVIEGLPAPQPGVTYVVSFPVLTGNANQPNPRNDLVGPATGPTDGAVRDTSGQVYAVRAFAALSASPAGWDQY